MTFAETKKILILKEKRHCPNNRKNLTDSRQDLVNHGTLVSKDGTH
jgi:hypothetical protein